MGEASSNSSTESLFANFMNKKSKNKSVAKRSCLTSKDSNKTKTEKCNKDSRNTNDTGTNSVLKSENCKKESTFVNNQAKPPGAMELPSEDNFMVFENVTAPGYRKTKPTRKKSETLLQVALACAISRGNEDSAKSNLQTATSCGSAVDRPCKRRRCRNRLSHNYSTRNDSNSIPEMTADQRQRIQSFIESIKPEFWSPFSDNVNNSVLITSTPKANAAKRSNANAARGSNVDDFFADSLDNFNLLPDPVKKNTSVVNISSQTAASHSKEQPIRNNSSTAASISATTKVNNSTFNTEDTIMSYVDSLIASEEQDINRQVDEQFDRFIENQRTACDSLRSISEIHNVFDDEVVVDNSVEIVSVSSPPRPSLSVTDDDVVFISSEEVNWEGLQNYDSPVVPRNSRRRKPQTENQTVPIKKRRKNASASETTTNPTETSVSDPISTPSDSNNTGQLTRECPICLEHLQVNNISSTVCGHVFCTSCIKDAIKSSRTCPNCRTKLTLKKIHPLYL